MYLPIVKTSDAEMRAIENLSSEVKDKVFPLIELTKSRKTKTLEHGDIFRRLDRLGQAFGDRRFILDLTTLEALQNPQILNLLDESNGFKNWVEFIDQIDFSNVVPVVHAFIDDDEDHHLRDQVVELSSICTELAFRVPIFQLSPNETNDCLSTIIDAMEGDTVLHVIVDAGLINIGQANMAQAASNLHLEQIVGFQEIENVYFAGSSFPRNVLDFGNDHYGLFALEELTAFENLKNEWPQQNLQYGDYGTVHPVRYDVRGGTFVPRVDMPLEHSIFYHRFRRENGGYGKAASHVYDDPLYDPVGCWGDEQIEKAAHGDVPGRSPSFWISARMNIHITRKSGEFE